MSKRIISLILVMTTLFSLVGCKSIRTPGIADNSNISSVPTAAEERKERVIHEATEYLKEKYPDDEFTYVSGRSPDWAYPYYELAFTTKKYDDQEFTVYGVYPDGESTDVEIPYFPQINMEQEFEYYDTYYSTSMYNEVASFFEESAHNYFSKKIIIRITLMESLYLAQTLSEKTFNDCMKERINFVHVDLISDSSLEEIEDSICCYLNYLVDNSVNVMIRYICVYPDYLEECKTKAIEDIMSYSNNYVVEHQSFDVNNEIHEYDKKRRNM